MEFPNLHEQQDESLIQLRNAIDAELEKRAEIRRNASAIEQLPPANELTESQAFNNSFGMAGN